MSAADIFYSEILPLEHTQCTLTGAEGKHAQTVRRYQHGDKFILTDGQGNGAYCTVTAVSPGELQLYCDALENCIRPSPKIVVVQAIAKGDKGDISFDVLTQSGADSIIPWQSQRSIRKIDTKIAQVYQRWSAIVLAAAKQSRRLWFPQMHMPMTTEQLIRELPGILGNNAQILLLDEDAVNNLAAVIDHSCDTICVIVGPEGGIDPSERAKFFSLGAHSVLMGATIYQSWIAGVAAISALSALTGRWSQRPVHIPITVIR